MIVIEEIEIEDIGQEGIGAETGRIVIAAVMIANAVEAAIEDAVAVLAEEMR